MKQPLPWGAKEAMNPENQWTVYRTRFLVRARQLTQPLAFTDALGREQSGRPGDYLVEFSDGIRRITNQALFEDIYVPLVPVPLNSATERFSPDGMPGVLSPPVARASPAAHTAGATA